MGRDNHAGTMNPASLSADGGVGRCHGRSYACVWQRGPQSLDQPAQIGKLPPLVQRSGLRRNVRRLTAIGESFRRLRIEVLLAISPHEDDDAQSSGAV